jgi:hypothetical protein
MLYRVYLAMSRIIMKKSWSYTFADFHIFPSRVLGLYLLSHFHHNSYVVW